MTMPFSTGAFQEQVQANGLEISAAGIVTIGGDVTFTLNPSGKVDVDIPTATLAINVPISGQLTPVFGLDGAARFSFGGGLGFQLESLQLNGVSIFNGSGGLTTIPGIAASTTPAAPTADLELPWESENIDRTTLNNQHYFEVLFTDYSGTGINPASITTSTVQLSGAAAAGVSITAVTQVDPTNNPGLFKFTFSGAFSTPNTTADPYNTVTVTFAASAFADNKGDRNAASSEQFYVFGGTDPPVPTAQLASPKNGATIGVDDMTQRPYLDVTFNPGTDGATLDTTSINGDEITVTDNGTVLAIAGETLLTGDTYRYTFATGTTFTAGVVNVTINAGSWSILLPNGGGSQAGGGGVSSFTLTAADPNASTTSGSFSLGPLTVSGASISLADMSMSGGKLTLAIAVSLNSATLNIGAVTAQLTGITGVFEVQVDLMKAAQAISDPASLLSAFSVPGNFTLGVAGLSINVPGALNVTASGITIHIDSGQDQSMGHNDPLVTVNSAQVTFPAFDGVGGGVQSLVVYSNGFTLGSANITVAPAGGINFAGLLVFNDLTLAVNNFGVTFANNSLSFSSTGPGGTSGITVSSSGVQFLPGKAVSGSITDSNGDHVAVSATFNFDSSGLKSFVFTADKLSINLGSFLTLSATGFQINTGASATQNLVSFGSASATLSAGGITISGSATNFAFLGDGSFAPGANFSVALSVGAATGDSFQWPSWLPIQIDAIGVTWPSVKTDPTNFILTLSASVTGIQGLGGLTFSGSIQGIQIDIGKLIAGEFPIVGLASIGVEVKGNLFGGQVSAELIGGILKLDANGNMIADTDTTTAVASRVFFAGLEGGFTMAGIGGFTIQLALSQLGPLDVFVSANLPEGILLDPDTGLSINNFAGGVQFFSTLPTITDPLQLRTLTPANPTAISPDAWLTTVKQQVVAQYKASLANPGQSGWAAAFTSPMTIIGSATIYSIYTSQQLFNGQVTLEFSTDGKIYVLGTLNFADNNLSVSGRLYANLSQISSGAATVLFLADVPDQVRILTLYGKLQMGFENAQGQAVTFTVPDDAPDTPTATLAGPADGGTISASTLNGRGYIDVSYAVPSGQQLTDSSITDLAPEFTLNVTGPGTVTLDNTQAPVLIDAATHTYRYWVVSNGTTAATVVTLTPIDSSWALVDTTSGNTLPNADDAATAFTSVDTTHLDTPYVDVELAATANQTVNVSTLGAGDLVFSQNGQSIGVSVDPTIAPTQMPGTNVYRYYLTGTFPTSGTIDVDFPAGAWSDSAELSSESSGSFTVVSPTTSIVAPFGNDGTVDVNAATAAVDGSSHYIDVVYSPPPGTSLDYDSIYGLQLTLTTPGGTQITLSNPTAVESTTDPTTGAPDETLVTDQTQAQTDNDTHFRYDFTGSWLPGARSRRSRSRAGRTPAVTRPLRRTSPSRCSARACSSRTRRAAAGWTSTR